MNLHRIAREWYKPDIQSTPELTNWEASFDGGADWVPGTLVGGELMWLVQGPDFDPAENSDPGVTATTIVATTYPQVRAVDNPEVIVRTPPKIRLLGPVPVPRPEVLVTLPGIVTQMQGQVAAAEAAVAAAGTATDATVADKVTNGAATGAALNARYATVITAKPGETPAATRSRINGALASGFSRVYRFAGDFSVNGPIAVPSGVTIDAQDATFTLVAGAYSNLLVNAATLANTRTIYAAMTSGSAVLTAAGTDMSTPDVGPFAAGLVGKPVVVQGAGSAGAPLVTTVASYQSATQITLAANAATTVTGQYATVGARDSGITVIGGTWTRAAGNNNWGSQGHYLTHTMRFRHIDGLRIIRPTFNGSNGKYAVNAGDCTAVLVDAPYAPLHNSDLVHINGPAEKVIIRSAMSDSINDDAVSLTAGDSTGALDRVRDTAGDITNVSVETVKSKVVTGTSSALKIIAGKTMDGSADYKVTGIRGSNLSGPTKTAAVVFIGDATGGRYDDIDVHGITSLGIQDGSTAGTVVLVHGGSVGRIGVHGVTTGPGDKDVVSADTPVDRLEVDDAHANGISGVLVRVGAAMTRLTISRSFMKGGVSPTQLVNVSAGSLGHLRVDDVTQEALAAADGSGLITHAVGTTVGLVDITALRSINAQYPFGYLRGVTTLMADSVRATGMDYWLYAGTASAAVTFLPSSRMVGDNDRIKEDVAGSTIVRRQSVLTRSANAVAAGETTLPREVAQVTEQSLTSGRLFLTYFTADRTQTLTNVTHKTRSAAAAGTTLARYGIYSVAANGDLALIASTANDTNVFSGTFAGYNKALGSAVSLVAGQRYAVGVLWVGTTAPKVVGITPQDSNVAPRLNGNVDGQTDLPASVTAATVANTAGQSLYALIN